MQKVTGPTLTDIALERGDHASLEISAEGDKIWLNVNEICIVRVTISPESILEYPTNVRRQEKKDKTKKSNRPARTA